MEASQARSNMRSYWDSIYDHSVANEELATIWHIINNISLQGFSSIEISKQTLPNFFLHMNSENADETLATIRRREIMVDVLRNKGYIVTITEASNFYDSIIKVEW